MNPENLNNFSNSHHPENSTDLPGSTNSIQSTNTTHSTDSKLSSSEARRAQEDNKLYKLFKLNKPCPERSEWVSTLIFYLSILFFIIGFNFSDVMVGNWYQQFMPNLNNRPISDITFLDSLNGFAITGDGTVGDTNYVLKTTNGGDNWNIIFSIFRDLSKVIFINQNTGFLCGGYNVSCALLLKTTNSGINWFSLNPPCNLYNKDMSVLNEDTIWLVDDQSAVGGVFRTTDGGASWTNQLFLGGQNPSKIYMFNARIGFTSTGAGLYKTTNSGENWSFISVNGIFSDMFFIDSLTGWKCRGLMEKTTDGGATWVNQPLPTGSFLGQGAVDFMNINNDTIWATGESIIVGGSPPTRGILFRTTNGGINWLFQLPDTSIHINRYPIGQFVDNKSGWAYNFNAIGIHTTNGGDPTWYIGIQQISSEIPKDFVLSQNYPNPFNPRTVIPFSLKQSAYVRLIVYDITGRKMQKMVDGNYSAGEYEVDFNGKFTASGVYFYKLTAENGKEVYSETKKMLLIK